MSDIMLEIIIFILILAAVSIVLLIAAKSYYQIKINRIVNGCVNGLSFLLSEKDERFNMLNNDREAAYFYTELERVFWILKQKEEKRNQAFKIVNTIANNMELSALLDDLLPKVLDTTNSSCGAFYLANQATGKLEIKASLGFSKNIYSDFDLNLGEGLVGTAALSGEVTVLTDIPDDSIYVFRTFLGKIKPKNIMVVPVMNADQLLGALLLASVYAYTGDQRDIVNLFKYHVGIAVSNGITYDKTKRLTNELKFQNKLIQNLNEELEKKVESRTVFLNNIIDSIKDYAIYAMDKNGIILAWNKGAEMIMGYNKDEVMGKSIKYIYSEEDASKVDARIEAAYSVGRYEESGWRTKKDGTSYYAEMVLFAMKDETGNLLGYTNITKDITYVKKVERALGFEKEFTTKLFEGSFNALVMASPDGVVETANKHAEDLLDKKGLIGDDLCAFFSDSEFMRKNLMDVSRRYGHGEWICVTKADRRSIAFSVNALFNDTESDAKLFINMHKV